MLTATDARAALRATTADAVERTADLFDRLHGTPEARRFAMLDGVPALIGYYADGTSTLAADLYQDQRDNVLGAGGYQAKTVVLDRTVKIRRAIAWSAEPLFDGGDNQSLARLAEIVQYETAKPFRDTIRGNRQQDPEAVGWQRVTAGGCKLCRMLADRGAVYRESSVRFAAHPHCHCGAQPVWGPNDTGETASVMQYTASRRNRTPAQQAALRDYLDTYY
jgi:hypothetical protein